MYSGSPLERGWRRWSNSGEGSPQPVNSICPSRGKSLPCTAAVHGSPPSAPSWRATALPAQRLQQSEQGGEILPDGGFDRRSSLLCFTPVIPVAAARRGGATKVALSDRSSGGGGSSGWQGGINRRLRRRTKEGLGDTPQKPVQRQEEHLLPAGEDDDDATFSVVSTQRRSAKKSLCHLRLGLFLHG